ncbi:hypothetical protein NL676_013504 [Syzygium grande]|nr:hypothetical protein NL676_013504 [Syzygium grande]
MKIFKSWCSSQKVNSAEDQNSTFKWIPPALGLLKINVDGAFVAGTSTGGIAGVLRDASGVLMGGLAREVKAQSALHAETLAVIEGLKFASEREKEKGTQAPLGCYPTLAI